jgi:hypothetical protein
VSMGRLSRALAATALAFTLAPGIATPASATVDYPKPLLKEWWFTTWELQNRVWPVNQGRGVTVAVIDSGVQADLPEFSGAVLPGTNISGGGGDGRTDTETGETGGHGTAMAALIVAQGGGSGFVGMAPKAKILPVVGTDELSIAKGIRYSVDHKAKVISISRGGARQCTDEMQQAVGYALEHDVVVVASSGDYGDQGNASLSPANCAGVLAVGAIGVSGSNFVPWHGTERQPYVAAAAPGGDVGGLLKDGQFHTSDGGTSPSAALTAGTAALVRSKYPDMSAREVVQRLIASCRDITPAGRDDQTGYGLIRPIHALTDSVSKSAPNPVFAAYDKWRGTNPGTGGDKSGNSAKSSSSKSFNGAPFVFLIVIVLIVLVVVVFLVARSRRRKRPAPYAGGAEGYGGGQGPPPSFGPPGDNRPPDPRARPTFQPPRGQGPPSERQ